MASNWTHRKNSKSRIDRAGDALRQGHETAEDIAVVSNWCSAHGLPLHFIKMLLKRRAIRVETEALVSQRQKRVRAVQNKLTRERVRLSQMQDLGGCRAVMSDIDAVNRLKAVFARGERKNPTGRHEVVLMHDYIAQPKPDGYRSLHYVFRYSSKQRWPEFNGQLIEVQIRTKLQHAWATAVETVDAVTGQSLKTSLKTQLADPDWQRFFVLMSCEIAHREGTPLVAEVGGDIYEIRREIQELAGYLNVMAVLEELTHTIESLSGIADEEMFAYLLVLDTQERETRVIGYAESEQDRLDRDQQNLEIEHYENPNKLIVRVHVDSVDALHEAYPSFYLNAQEFLMVLAAVIEKTSAQVQQTSN